MGETATITAALRGWAKAAGGVGEDLEWRTELLVGEKPSAPPKSQSKNRKSGSNKGPSKGGGHVAVIWPEDERSPRSGTAEFPAGSR